MPIRAPSADTCPFCDYLAGRTECAFVVRGATVSAFVNLRQYERGAMLIVPQRHAVTALDLTREELSALHIEAVRVGRAAVQAFAATGLNIFQNNGIDAGQSVPHFHMHVVPRYPGGDPIKVFQAGKTPIAPFEERVQIAAAVRNALVPTDSAGLPAPLESAHASRFGVQ